MHYHTFSDLTKEIWTIVSYKKLTRWSIFDVEASENFTFKFREWFCVEKDKDFILRRDETWYLWISWISAKFEWTSGITIIDLQIAMTGTIVREFKEYTYFLFIQAINYTAHFIWYEMWFSKKYSLKHLIHGFIFFQSAVETRFQKDFGSDKNIS
jgi:hypothetical protein